MFANRFSVVIDACTLADAARRDLILSLVQAELFRVQWSGRILAETEQALIAIHFGRGDAEQESTAKARRSISHMTGAFPEAMIEGFERIERTLEGLPDPDDAHVIAAAIHSGASLIVTENVRDFSEAILSPSEIEVKTADAFIADTIDLDYARSIPAVAKLRQRLKNPALTPSELLERWRLKGLVFTADILNPHLANL
jgi:predicted nucleic acid-binding protein